MDAQKKEKPCITLQEPLSVRVFFSKFGGFFSVPFLAHLINMPASFCDKVTVPKYKTECKG